MKHDRQNSGVVWSETIGLMGKSKLAHPTGNAGAPEGVGMNDSPPSPPTKPNPRVTFVFLALSDSRTTPATRTKALN